eukprot:gene10367-24932_t
MDLQWEEVLQNLSVNGNAVTRSKIEAATTLALSQPDRWKDKMKAVVSKLVQSVQPQEKLALLYVVDAVLNRVHKLQDAATLKMYKSAVSRQLPALIGLAAPDGIDSVQKVKKVVLGWKQKKIFDEMTINVAQAQAGTDPSRLALSTGSVYELVSLIDANWIQGRCTTTGKEGMIPRNYVEPYAEPPAKKQRVDANLEPYTAAITPAKFQANPSLLRRVGEYTPSMPTPPTPPGSPTPYGYRRLPSSAAADDEDGTGAAAASSGGGGRKDGPTSASAASASTASTSTSAGSSSASAYQDVVTNTIRAQKPHTKKGVTVVHIFDLDETLIQFDKLQAPRHAERNGGAATAEEVGKRLQQGLEDLVFKVAETHFFFDALDGCNQHHTAALKSKDDGRDLAGYNFEQDRFAWPSGPTPAGAHPVWTKLSYRFRAMAERYGNARKAVADAHGALAEKAKATHRAKYALVEKPANVDRALTFAAGDLVEVTKYDPAGWSEVVVDGVAGVAPSNYLEPLSASAAQRAQQKPRKDPAAAEVFTVRDAEILTDTQAASLLALHADLAVYTDGWLEAAVRLLESLSSVQGAELVLVTNSELSAALAKLIIFRLARFFPAENVYSSATHGKEKVFTEIKDRYNNGGGGGGGGRSSRCDWYAYGDGPEEEAASSAVGIPFKKIVTHAQLHKLLRITERRGGNMI